VQSRRQAGGGRRPARIDSIRGEWPLAFRTRRLSLQELDTSYLKPKEEVMSTQNSLLRGWTVALAGTGINLALGILYAYSMLKGDIGKLFNGAGDPYAVACLSFALSMIIGGKMQDKLGPRFTAIVGGLFVGAGFLVCSQTTNYWGWIVGFGLLAGLGFGFGYSAATPPALKWFPPAKTGLIAGIVVAGFGIAPVYLAPVCKYLLGAYGLQQTMMILGVAFIAIVCGMAMLVSNPPEGYVAQIVDTKASNAAAPVKKAGNEMTPSQILRTGKFYTLWTCFFIGAGAGLMVIGSIAGMAKHSMGEYAFVAVAVMSVGNAGGRIVAGVLSDKLGRANTLMIMLLFQATLMFAAIPVIGGDASSGTLLTLLATFIGFNYGSNLSLFPSFAKDLWGTKHYGLNYGALFSAWGVGAFVLVKVSAALKDKFGGFTVSFATAGVMLLVGAMLAMSLREKKAAAPATASDLVEDEDMVLQKVGAE